MYHRHENHVDKYIYIYIHIGYVEIWILLCECAVFLPVTEVTIQLFTCDGPCMLLTAKRSTKRSRDRLNAENYTYII